MFNPYLLDLIERHHVTRTDLARAMRLDRSTVSKKLSGDRPTTLDELHAIIDFLRRRKIRVDPDKVLERKVGG